MNRILLILLSFFSLYATAQNVSTVVTYKNVLLEDFTGFKCGNCPDGHAYVNKIKLSHPDNIFPIAVHAGYYATVSALDQPNFIINEGELINDYFGINSYPSGMTNRTDMGAAGLVQSRSYWTSSCRTLTRQIANVNVWVQSEYNKNSRVISTDVELYYTTDVLPKTSALCVSLLQNRILARQAGADMGDEYVHNHVLRAMFTPVWGDTIETSDEGTLIKKHYEYTLPEVIGNIDTDPQHLDIVAYVLDADKGVMNVNGCEVKCPDMTLPTAATLEAYKILPVRNNAFPYLECYLVNEGTDTIKSANFVLTIDDEDKYDCTWTASSGEGLEPVAGQQRGYLRVPVEWPASAIAGGCDYKFQLKGLNGKTYTGETIRGSFAAMQKVTGDLSVTIKTDRYADDNTFRLLDANGNVVTEYGPYTEGSAVEHKETIHFPGNGIYCFEVTDSWGNGILSPRGSIKWYDLEGKLIASNTDIQDWGYRVFFDCETVTGIESVHSSSQGSGGKAGTESIVHSSDCFNLAGQKISKKYKGIVIYNGKKFLSK